MFLIDYAMIILTGLVLTTLVLILNEAKKIQKKVRHPDDRPKNEKLWGYGKNKK